MWCNLQEVGGIIMILKTLEFKEACQNILFAIDNKDVSLFNETLELVANGDTLNLNITNREYYVTVKFNLETSENFKASVNAKTFLSLISKITTETLELSTEGNKLKVKANGNYVMPLIFNGDEMLSLPTIDLGTVTNEMEISSDILLSILANNSKELLRGIPVRDVQKYYYVDELGAITFTSGACVTSFSLPNQIKMLLSDKVVKLFKLFKSDNTVKFEMGQLPISDTIVQTNVKFTTNKVSLIAKLSDSSLISSVPVEAIRGMANKSYPHTLVVDRGLLLQALNRIILFNDENKTYGNIEINNSIITIKDFNNNSTESVTTVGNTNQVEQYHLILDLKNLRLILDGCVDQYVTMCFGDNRAVVIKKQGVSDIIPEVRVN